MKIIELSEAPVKFPAIGKLECTQSAIELLNTFKYILNFRKKIEKVVES